MSENTAFLVPAPGLLLRMPNGGTFPEAGDLVVVDPFIQRRIDDGDLLPAPMPGAAPAAPPAKPAKGE